MKQATFTAESLAEAISAQQGWFMCEGLIEEGAAAVIEAAAASDRASLCRVYVSGDSFVCEYHKRSWTTGICPGLRA